MAIVCRLLYIMCDLCSVIGEITRVGEEERAKTAVGGVPRLQTRREELNKYMDGWGGVGKGG